MNGLELLLTPMPRARAVREDVVAVGSSDVRVTILGAPEISVLPVIGCVVRAPSQGTRAFRRGAGVLAVALLAVVPARAAEPVTRVVVKTDNYAAIDSGTLTGARQLVDQIYAAIGVAIIWVDQSDQTVVVERRTREVRLLLLSPEMSNRKIRVEKLPDGVLGQASGPTGLAYIHVQRIMELSITRSRDRFTDLGLVIAHEIGHLLLPKDSHSAKGIMRDNLVGQKADSRFTDDQARIIRERLSVWESQIAPKDVAMR